MDKIKQVYHFLKDNPRYRSALILLIYAIFFTFVIILIRNSNKYYNDQIIINKEETIIEKHQKQELYSFIYTNNDTIIEGKYQKGELIFSSNKDYLYNGTLYEKKDFFYYKSTDKIDPYLLLTPKKLQELINQSNLVEETTNYIDNTIKSVYTLNTVLEQINITLITSTTIDKIIIDSSGTSISIEYNYINIAPFTVTIGE